MQIQRNQGVGFGCVKAIQGVSKKEIPALYKFLNNRAEKFILVKNSDGKISISGSGHPITFNPDQTKNENSMIHHLKQRLDGAR